MRAEVREQRPESLIDSRRDHTGEDNTRERAAVVVDRRRARARIARDIDRDGAIRRGRAGDPRVTTRGA